MKDEEKPAAPAKDRAADLERREETLTDELDDLEARVRPKKPVPPPIGAMF
ncbi:MAG: hypothetical protein ACR2FH_02965 [Caulobacteraceae bacterium]